MGRKAPFAAGRDQPVPGRGAAILVVRSLLRLLLLIGVIACVPPIVGWMRGGHENAAALPAHGRPVVIAGEVALNVVERGSGTPVVLIHGLPSSAYDWGETPAALADRGHRVVAYDRAGFGYSSRPAPADARYTYESNAADLKGLLDALSIDRASLVGWSYGGAVVQTFAERWPDRVRSATLVGAVGPGFEAREASLLDRVIDSPFAAQLLGWVGSVPPVSRAMTTASLNDAFSGSAHIPDGYVEFTRAMLALPGTLDSFVWEARRSRPENLRPQALRAPSLVLHGEDDRLVEVAVGKDLHAKLPDSELVIVPRGSHMLPITHPALVAERVHRLDQAAGR